MSQSNCYDTTLVATEGWVANHGSVKFSLTDRTISSISSPNSINLIKCNLNFFYFFFLQIQQNLNIKYFQNYLVMQHKAQFHSSSRSPSRVEIYKIYIDDSLKHIYTYRNTLY